MKRAWKIIFIILGVFAVQLITFHFFAIGQLKRELLTGDFGDAFRDYDSVYVRDSHDSGGCLSHVGIFYSHNLAENVDILKSRMQDKYIYYQVDEEGPYRYRSRLEEKSKAFYYTYVHMPEYWTTQYFSFEGFQIEEIILNHDYYRRKDAKYVWVLFFWTNTRNSLYESPVCSDGQQ